MRSKPQDSEPTLHPLSPLLNIGVKSLFDGWCVIMTSQTTCRDKPARKIQKGRLEGKGTWQKGERTVRKVSDFSGQSGTECWDGVRF